MPHTATATKIRVGLYVRLEAKPGQEDAVAAFLKSALPIVEREPATVTWQKAPELLASPPVIQKIDILAAKLPD